jgi:Calcineurin-like phosphoesterase
VTFGQTEPRWYLPHLWYDFVHRDPAGFSVHFLVVDSQALRWDANDAASQWAWIEQTLATTTAEWKVVVSHHPPYACGNQGPTDATIEGQVGYYIHCYIRTGTASKDVKAHSDCARRRASTRAV